MRRGGIVESRHRGHIVQVGSDAAVERALGDPEALVTLRSAVKPFALVALIEAGAVQAFQLTPPELAVMAASHSGEDLHVRTLQAVFRRANLSQSLLACGSDGAPLDRVTATRLARDGETPGPIRHNCSGFHAASLLLSRHAGWSLEDYWQPEHPSQLAVRAVVGRVFGVNPQTMRTAIDSCGVLTYAFPLVEVARAYAFLADPHGMADTAARSAVAPALTRVRDAMLAAPEMVGGTRDRLDTALMKAVPGRLVAKGGAEGLRGVAILPAPRADAADQVTSRIGPGQRSAAGTPRRPGGGAGRPGARGCAIKIEDGDGRGRAGWAAGVEALWQVGALDERALKELARYHRPPVFDPRGEQCGEAVPEFQLAPISELI
jgi:L-asparaginase II